MQLLYRLFVGVVLIGVLVGCNRKLSRLTYSERLTLPIGTTVTFPCILYKEDQTITCADVVLSKIKTIEDVVVNPTRTFEEQFRGYFYSDFFRVLLVEEDLHKYFVEKTKIIDVRPKGYVKDRFIKECETCNAVATIQFEGKQYYYPFTADKSVEAVLSDHTILVGRTEHLYFTLQQNGQEVIISMESSNEVRSSYKLTEGSAQKLIEVLHAFKFPE